MRQHRRIFSNFLGLFALRIIIFAAISAQVLSLERRTPSNKAGAGQDPRWYEKGWKNSASSNTDAVDIDGGRSQRLRSADRGSGAGGVGDLDDTASGYGEDDEDSEDDDSVPGASGDGWSDIRASGDGAISLPNGHVTSHTPEPDEEETTFIASWPSTTSSTMAPTTSTTSAHRPSVFTTSTTKPFIGPVVTITTAPKAASPRIVETTTSPARVMTSGAMFTTRSTTTTQAMIQSRPRTTTTTTAATTTTTRESHKPKSLPPMLDDTNKATPQNFWMRPGVLAGLIGGAVAGLLAAILLVMFVVYRMRKKDEGSYALEEPKSPPAYTYAYQKAPTREFYA